MIWEILLQHLIQLEISYNCVPVDPVEEVSPNGINYFHLDGSALEVYTPGIYAITASYEDKTFSIDLFVRNIFWVEEPIILVETNPTSFNKSTNTLTINNFYNKIKIKDYTHGNLIPDFPWLSETKERTNRVVILIEINDKIVEIEMNQNKSTYTHIFDSSDLSSDDTISVKFRYQSITGIYCYSEEIIIKVE